MKEHIKHAAKSFWSGFTSAIPDALRYMRDNPRWVCLALLAILFIAIVSSIKGLALFLIIIGSVVAIGISIGISIFYLLDCIINNTWKPWT